MSDSFHYRGSRPLRVQPRAQAQRLPTWRRLLGWILLLLALLLILASAALALSAPQPAGDLSMVAPGTDPVEATATASLEPTATAPAPSPALNPQADSLPTISPGQITALLAEPPQPLDELQALENSGLSYDPFTIIPQRSRARMTAYTAVQGDTIDGIARRFGISREAIAWCNPHRLALVLLPGDVVSIPPADGACHTVLASQGKDIGDIAEQYGVDDPYVIIDAPANDLPDIAPETQLPSGARLFIPGGEGAIITWDAPVESDSAGNVIAFAPGHANSCGAAPGGGTFWTNPLPSGSFVRGFYAGHSGIDISAPTGTPILAANGGPILYAGWNSWGYGNTVVIGHGPFSTLYGHMSSLAARCGNVVAAGQVIGYVGSTGNSSGPHLHFEIRYQNAPQDPSATVGIGW